MNTDVRTVVMDHTKVKQVITRIAHQIYENNFEEKSLVIIGIKGQGYILAERLLKELKAISPQPIALYEMDINKDKPLKHDVAVDYEESTLKNKAVFLVDDVLNSGRTLIYAVRYALGFPVKKLQTVCLVDRKHRRFPVRADYVGLTLATTLQEHITVEFGKQDCVYLD